MEVKRHVMRCQNYQQRLIRTLVKDRESISKSRLRRCRAQMLILKSRFQSATAPELEREVHPLVWVFERVKSLVAIIFLLAESARGQLEQPRILLQRERIIGKGGNTSAQGRRILWKDQSSFSECGCTIFPWRDLLRHGRFPEIQKTLWKRDFDLGEYSILAFLHESRKIRFSEIEGNE